jgi:hypothetical protein
MLLFFLDTCHLTCQSRATLFAMIDGAWRERGGGWIKINQQQVCVLCCAVWYDRFAVANGDV